MICESFANVLLKTQCDRVFSHYVAIRTHRAVLTLCASLSPCVPAILARPRSEARP